jgi:hypothetical protein
LRLGAFARDFFVSLSGEFLNHETNASERDSKVTVSQSPFSIPKSGSSALTLSFLFRVALLSR